MSRKDRYHDVVKQALIREGWTISHDPYILNTDPKLAVDLGVERIITAERKNEKIAVEIKSFINSSQVSDLEDAVGQYNVYNIFLKRQEPKRKLYLAVPYHAFVNIFSREVGQITVKELSINLIIYSLSEGEPLQWKIP
ncbi:element excision factor XisH family protein [Candidatus Parabeggiatoa sp. HSG14]|uniref:element excision factor XisH family protein n=1 Tax=Candidatus Parabeggiatoa sp. HSG14 TaxID=3055593 RepID=UPI0025A875C1|nr:element excision factor XisH family protein [Thiotrichales bacterium HSG14]